MVIGILVARETGVDGLPEESRNLVLDVLAGTLVDYLVPRHVGETHHLVKLSNREQSCVSGYLRSPEFQPQAAVELKPDSPVFRCTHWVFSHWNLALPELPILVHP